MICKLTEQADYEPTQVGFAYVDGTSHGPNSIILHSLPIFSYF